jgi:hypothetical protein
MNKPEFNDETVMFVVISDMDGLAGPFLNRATAHEYAEAADGSVFRLVEDEAGGQAKVLEVAKALW